MAYLRKALSAKCPQCGHTSVLIVSSFKTALRSGTEHSFECPNCDTEFSVSNKAVGLDVISVPSNSGSASPAYTRGN
jgi:transposase-like protein